MARRDILPASAARISATPDCARFCLNPFKASLLNFFTSLFPQPKLTPKSHDCAQKSMHRQK
jgi:hypothetical protein